MMIIRKLFCLLLVSIFLWFFFPTGSMCFEEGLPGLTLQDAYQKAMETHEEIRSAATEVEKSRLLPNKALSVMLPQVNASAGYYHDKDQLENTYNNGTPWAFTYRSLRQDRLEGDLEVIQPFFRPRFSPLRKQAIDIIDRDVELYCETVQNVLFNVSRAFYEVLKANELMRNAEETKALAEESLTVAQSRFSAGAVTEDVVIQAELDVTTAQTNVIQRRNQQTLAQDALKNLLGTEDDYGLIKPADLPKPEETYQALLEMALSNRHDFRIALFNKEVARSNIDLEKARFYPSLEGGWTYYGINHPTDWQHENSWTASVTVRLPIFEGGLRFWDLKESRMSLSQATLSVEALQKDIPFDVEDALLTLGTDESLLENAKKRVQLAEKNYEIVFAKFQHGATTSLDLTAARAMLDMAKVEQITTFYDYQVNLLGLQRAIGMFARNFFEQQEVGAE